MPNSGSKVPGLGSRWAVELRQSFPRNGAKLVASRYEVSLKTANGWLTGQVPRLEHFINVSDDLGPAFVANVIGGAAGWARYLAFGASLEDCASAINRLNADLEDLVPVVRRERLRK